MEDSPFENTINSSENCWIPNDPVSPKVASQHILLDGSESNFSHTVHGKDVVIMASQASGVDQEGVGSSMVKFKPIVNYDWDCKHEYGNLVVCHTNKIYFAYVLKNYNQGNTTGIVRVTNMKTTQRTLLKNFVGKVCDINFADCERVILGAVDSVGNLFVYELFEEEEDQSIGQKLLLNCTRPDKSLQGSHRLIWCSYIGEDEKPASEGAAGEIEAPLDDSLMLLLTHDENAELWHIDLITRTSTSTQVSTDAMDCGFYIIRSHSQAITDAAFSPDATAVATASLDGDVKFFQVDMSDSNSPKCIHYWQPHEGNPVSFLHFLDDHKNKNPQAHLWKFAVTGCNENQTIRIWDCQNWSCLQTLTFVSPIDLLNIEENASREFMGRGLCKGSSIKARFDLSSSYLVLSDMKRRVIYVLEVTMEGGEARVSTMSEFPLMNPCLSFAVVDASVQRGGAPQTNSSDNNGFQSENDWNIDNSEDDYDCGRLSKTSVYIKLYSVHSRALQELHIKFFPKCPSIESVLEIGDGANIQTDFPNARGIKDSFPNICDELSSISQRMTTSLDFCPPSIHPSILGAPVHASQASASPVLVFQQERQSSSLSSSSNLPQLPFLLSPDAFVSPRESGRGVLSSSVDFGADNDEEEEDDDIDDPPHVEARGDVEGADRDRPDGGSRVRSSGGNVSGADHFFDRGGDGGGDGDSSGASTASQEVTEILEGVEEAMGGLEANAEECKDDYITADNDKFSDSHLRTIEPQPTQLSQPPVVHPHHSFLHQPQQHNIAHHIPNLLQMPMTGSQLFKEAQPLSSAKMSGLGHQQLQPLLNSTQSPRSIHQQAAPSHQSPMNTKWPQAAGIINVDELMRKSEALEIGHKERRGHDGGSSLPFIEADELERRLLIRDPTAEVLPKIAPSTLQDLMELVRSQSEELRSINAKLQNQSQLEMSLRSANHQIEVLSKEVKVLSSSLEQGGAVSCHIDEKKLSDMFEKHARDVDENVLKSLRSFLEGIKGNFNEQFGRVVANDVKADVMQKLEQSLETLKEKLSNDFGHKLATVDNTIRNNIAKVFKSKPVTDSIGQSVSADLKGSLKTLYQDSLGPSFEKGCGNVMQQLNSTFQVGTQQYTKSLELHLGQLKKAIENQKNPAIQQIKVAADMLAQNNTQYKQSNGQLVGAIEVLRSLVQESAKKSLNVDEGRLSKILNEHSECMTNQVRDIVSEKLSCILRDHQVAIKDQFEYALRSVTPAPSVMTDQSLKTQITQNIHLSKFNTAFQLALSASDLSLVEFACENADACAIFGDQCLLDQSVLLSLIHQLAADINTKTELKYRYLDEAVVSLDPNDPVTREHLPNIVERLCSNLADHLDRKSGGPLDRELRKLLKRATVLLRSHPRNKC